MYPKGISTLLASALLMGALGESNYAPSRSRTGAKTPLTNKQKAARAKAKRAKQARKK